MKQSFEHTTNYIELTIGQHDVSYKCLETPCASSNAKKGTLSTRGCVTKLSKKAGLNLLSKLRNTQHTFKQLITLTYLDYPSNGETVKDHIGHLLNKLRQHFPGIQYCWVLESQTLRNNAPHLHLVINHEIPNVRMNDKYGEYFYSKYWSEAWSSITGNSENKDHQRFGFRIDPITDPDNRQLAYYFAKPFIKSEQKEFDESFTNPGRFWGTSRRFCEPRLEGVYRAEDIKWILKLCFHYANLERAKKGLKPYRYSVDKGCSIWNMRQILFGKVFSTIPAATAARLVFPINWQGDPPIRDQL